MRALRFFTAAALALILLIVGIASLAAPAGARQGSAVATHPYAAHVAEAAQRFGIPEAWIWAVMRIESRGDPHAISRVGAMGLMQLMPATWAAMRTQHGLGSDPFDPRDNILAGAAYLRAMHDRYGDATGMLAAYNAGPGRTDDYRARGRPLPAETLAYLERLTPIIGSAADMQVAAAAPTADPSAWRRSALFVRATAADADTSGAPSGGANGDAAIAAPAPSNPLFVRSANEGRPQ